MKLSAIAVMALGVMLAVALLGCGGDDNDADLAVFVDSVEPASAAAGAAIVIHGRGFDATNNDVGFYPSGVTGWGDSSFITHVPSADGKTLRFNLKDTLGACPESQTGGCDDIGMPLPAGDLTIAVYNRSGTSNEVPFTREGGTPGELATNTVFKSGALLALKAMLDEAVAASRGERYPAGYSVSVREDDTGQLYIDLSVGHLEIASLPHAIPEAMEGYEVRVRTVGN